jgi:hypothetical protein
MLAFPTGLLPRDRIDFKRFDGRKSFVQVIGERSVRRSGGRSRYRYHLAPAFSVRGDLDGAFTALLRVRIRLTDLEGRPLARRTAVSRRKKLCKSWWNNEWLARTLAVSSFLAEGEDEITVGDGEGRIVVSAEPLSWEVPVCIDETLLEKTAWDRDVVLPSRDDDDGEAEGDEQP